MAVRPVHLPLTGPRANHGEGQGRPSERRSTSRCGGRRIKSGLTDAEVARAQQQLELRKDIYLQTTAGYEAWLNQAFVDMGKGTVTSDEHVDVKWAGGTLSADKMKITEGGDNVRFDGKVVMNLDKVPSENAASARSAKAQPAASKSSNPK